MSQKICIRFFGSFFVSNYQLRDKRKERCLIMTDRYTKEYPLTTIPVKINKSIKNVLDEYEKLQIPRKVLMKDYLAIRGNLYVQKAYNPWAYKYKGIEKQEVECGVSVAESGFNITAVELRKQKPTDVIKAAFYKNRNDSAFECGFLLEEFMCELNGDSIIVNPSPDMIIKFEECKRGNCYAIIDPIIAELYKIQFPEAKFYYVEENPKKIFKRMLIVNRDYPVEKTEVLMKWIYWCEGQVLALLPNTYVDHLKYNALSLIRKAEFSIERVLILNKGIIKTKYKKCLLYMTKSSTQTEFWRLENTVLGNKNFKIINQEIYVEHERYWKDDATLIKLWNSKGLIKGKEIIPNEVKEIAFSNEIHLFYSIYADRKNRYAGSCWYREIKNVDPLIYGKRVSQKIEKGLRAKTKDEILHKLPQIVFDDRVFPYIYTDIVTKFVHAGISISLKAMWILVRNTMLESRVYDENVLNELFQLGGQELAEYNIENQTEEELIDLLVNKLKVHKSIKYMVQLNVLFEAIRKEKFIRYNPLREMMDSVNKKASERQQEVRNVLVKKHFSATEEKKIFEFLTKKTWNEMFQKQIPKCVEESIYLLGVIRLFTGMSLREVCALFWSDFVQIEGTNEYQLKVSKFIDSTGKIISHTSNDDWLKFRCVPVARPLRILLKQRKEYLITRGISLDKIAYMPIITATEDIAELKKSPKRILCKTSRAQNFCRKVLQQAIKEKQELVLPDAKGELLTDIYKYGGDIFVTNIKMRLNHYCGMTQGEFNYMLGLNPKDTFSRHYCDYTNSLVQYAMVEKLNRWTALYESNLSDLKEMQPQIGNINKNRQKILSGPYKQKCAFCEMILNSTKDSSCKLLLQISSEHEVLIEVDRYGGILEDGIVR